MTTFASLFTGVLGWDIGAERAGFTPLWTCEIHPFARRVISKYSAVRCYEDVRRLHERGACLRPAERGVQEQGGVAERAGQRAQPHADAGCSDCADRPDILLASPPCQDLSVAGKHSGLAGTRSGLFFDFARLAGELCPTWILMEQVPGLLSSKGGRDFEIVLGTLDELGYGLSWRVLDSRYFGVPQRRRRVYLVGHLGEPCPAEILFESEGGAGNPAASGAEGEGVARDAEIGAGLARSLRARPNASHREDSDTYVPVSEWSHSLTQSMGKRHDPDTDTLIAAPLTSGGHPNSNMPGRHAEDDVNLVAAVGVRRLTPVECARLQGFPDHWTCLCDQPECVCPDSPQYAAYGNAVTVNTVSWILRNLAGVIRAEA